MHKVVGRIAPTPSAGLHIGNIFSCLVAWLAAKQAGGELLLRIEDLDVERSKPEYVESILSDLRLLGLTWDNTQVVYQGARTEAYANALEILQGEGLVYPCFCSRADLHAASAPHRGERYIYAGTCAGLSAQEQQRVFESGRRAAIRLRVPDKSFSFNDRLQGPFSMNLAQDCGDFIVRRSDGVFAYQLAVVVDDLYQGVNQIVRGCDLLDSAPQQCYLRELLQPDAPTPEYLHIPLLVDGQGRRLSKRERDQTLAGTLEHFDSTESFLGYLAGTCGLLPGQDPSSLDQLLERGNIQALAGLGRISWQLPN